MNRRWKGIPLKLVDKVSDVFLAISVFVVVFSGALAATGALVVSASRDILVSGSTGSVNIDWLAIFIVFGPPLIALVTALISTRVVLRVCESQMAQTI